MIAEILSVGTEILLGEILNTNSKYLSGELASIGIDVYNHTSVGDNEKRLIDAVDIAFKRADLIITTGGLGPTDDDLTKEVISKYFGKKLITHNPTVENIKNYFANSDLEMPLSNLKQAELPEDCTVFMNDNGTASGCMIEENGKIVIMLPGPPNEVIPMFRDKVKPYLIKKSDKVLVSKSLNLCGIGESDAAEIIRDLMLNSKNPTIAPYAGKNEVRFRITASGKNENEAKELLKPTVDKLYKIFEEYIYGEDNDGAKIGISTTGIAGPDGGTKEKPVGLVYLGIAIEGKEPIYKELMLKGDRTKIREKTVMLTIYELLKNLKKL